MLRSLLICLSVATLSAKEAQYSLGPESTKHGDGVPKGKVTRHESRSEIFEGTVRQYFVYVPDQYEAGKEAALMVFQDGHAYVDEKGQVRAPIVFDNLIHSGEMPVTIGVFVNPGLFAEKIEGNQGWQAPKDVKSNRSFEYDTLSDDYVRMLDEELLPEVGKTVKLSKDPAMRAICGMSSGGICAFTAAWERPQSFGKVVSHIGSFTNIRGGDAYPGIIRKADKRPIRVFLQDGTHDLDNPHGNWWLGNLEMESALRFRDYDLKTVWGHGEHNGKHGGAIFPATMRWLWRDWNGKPSEVHPDFGPVRSEIGSHIFVTTPTPGLEVQSGFTLSGVSRTFESNVQWRLRDSDGKELAKGHATGGGVDGSAPFETKVEYQTGRRQVANLEVFEEDASDGEGRPPAKGITPLILTP